MVHRSSCFFFETSWLAILEFKDLVQELWYKLLVSLGWIRDAIDGWDIQSLRLRQYLKGWGANKGKQARELKAQILA
jgi:hypothetical protein